MTDIAPLIQLSGIVKAIAAPEPFRLEAFAAAATDRVVLAGFDEAAAELFVHLVTGAALPDEGRVLIAGRDTRAIATDTEWLESLDRFGIVTKRAVLIEKLSAAANLALPVTVSIDPMSDDVRRRVLAEGAGVGLSEGQLNGAASDLGAADRLRLHLARAVIGGPELILLEHPTAGLDAAGASGSDHASAFGATLASLSAARRFGWIAVSNDDAFAKASGGRRLALDSKTGKISVRRSWKFWNSP